MGLNNALGETLLLILVHVHNLSPICGNLRQVQALAQVHQVEDMFLEARTTEANGGMKEFVADTGIVTDSVGYLVDVGTSGPTNGREH